MNIDPKTPICGMRPAALKKLLAKRRIDLNAALAALGPEVSDRLACLVRDGWIRRAEPGVWEITDKGHRLVATHLTPRFRAKVGRQILRQVIEIAHAINADDSEVDVVSELVLFGSMVDAADEDLVGDLDIGLVRRNRWPDEAQHTEAMRRVMDQAPEYMQGIRAIMWLDHRLYRRLRSPSPNRIHVELWEPLQRMGFLGTTIFKE